MNSSSTNEKVLSVRGRMVSIADMLEGMANLGASDLFLKTGSKVCFKIKGRLSPFESDLISLEVMNHVMACFLGPEDQAAFLQRRMADVVHATETNRYRVHFATGQTGPYATIRVIESEVLALHQLGLQKPVLEKLTSTPKGLILVCGSTDAGKTVTCASLVNHFNSTKEQAILTLEDPIEYILQDRKSLVIQREVGLHVPSFPDGVKSALRENLDVIFVGEIREPETMEQVLRAAEMGHLCISTLHAEDTLSAVSRLIGSFSPTEQPRVRQALASTLSGIVFQRLLPRTRGGRVPCTETLWVNRPVRTILRAGDFAKLGSYIGRPTGGITYTDCLEQLRLDRVVDEMTVEAEYRRLQAMQ